MNIPIRPMETINAYKTFDGKIFGSKEKAEEHECRAREDIQLKDFVHHIYNESLTVYDLSDRLIEEKESLRQILNGSGKNNGVYEI